VRQPMLKWVEGKGVTDMTVSTVSYWKGGKHEQMVAVASKAKAFFTKHGAERFQLNFVHAGPDAGQWVAVITYSNWESYGKAMQALTNDPEYQALLAQVSAISELTGRRIVVSIDL